MKHTIESILLCFMVIIPILSRPHTCFILLCILSSIYFLSLPFSPLFLKTSRLAYLMFLRYTVKLNTYFVVLYKYTFLIFTNKIIHVIYFLIYSINTVFLTFNLIPPSASSFCLLTIILLCIDHPLLFNLPNLLVIDI